ncbi:MULTISPECIES: restriction endonuclease subunit S [unclassified Bradyrhizobium]|uniref:restriction endonuclease subunit S n=1 Tax=unclassified Bradyrhizobium TaxID=2631580 RepID=UPI002916501D|nr:MULTISPECIES: restriction endonuclease subunit S [unclassified Bradyrhizobium]
MKNTLPSDWTSYAFGEIATVANGQVDPKADNYRNMILVGPDHIREGGGELVAPLSTALEQDAISGKYIFNKGQVIYSKIRPNLNKAYFAEIDGLCSADIYPIEFSRELVNPKFTYYTLLGERFFKAAVSASMRSGIPKVNRDDLSIIEIALPPLAEQQRIVAVLDAWEQAIGQSERLIAAKQRRFDAARVRLIEVCQSSGKDSNSWAPTEFVEIAEELKQRNAAGHGPERVMGVIKGEGLVPMRAHVMASDLRRYLVVPPRAIAYNPMRLNIGSIAASRYDEDVLVSPDYVVFRARKGRADPDFLRFLIGTKRWRDHLITVGSGSVRTRIYFDGLAEMVLRVPDVREQKRIGHILAAMEQDLKTTIEVASALRAQKRGLMQKLLTGEWRLDERFDPSPAARQAHLGGAS